MEEKCFPKWTPDENVDWVYDVEQVRWRGEKFVLSLLPDHLDHEKRSKHRLEMAWQDVLCYQVTKESYRPDWWKSDPEQAWTFYVSQSSEFLKNFRKDNVLAPETVYHFVVVGTNFVVDILSDEYPTVRFVK